MGVAVVVAVALAVVLAGATVVAAMILWRQLGQARVRIEQAVAGVGPLVVELQQETAVAGLEAQELQRTLEQVTQRRRRGIR